MNSMHPVVTALDAWLGSLSAANSARIESNFREQML